MHSLNSGALRYDTTIKVDEVRQTYVLRINSISVALHLALNGSVPLVSLYMCLRYSHRITPNTCMFPELMFGAKLGSDVTALLVGYGNATLEW
jgi:hypothetical protein